MEIYNLDFEKKLIIQLNNQSITLTVFRTIEHGNIKFGIDAPAAIRINRQEIYLKKQEKLNNSRQESFDSMD